MAVYTDVVTHKIGAIQVYWNDANKLLASTLGFASHLDTVAVKGDLQNALPQVHDYLKHFDEYERPAFNSNIFDFTGFSDFTVTVYQKLFTVPKGAIVTYGELADMVGHPRAARAVGTAMSKNRFLVLIPCHRVLSVTSLGGYTSGLDVKLKLLEYEGINIDKWR